jgi:hypothetical protein
MGTQGHSEDVLHCYHTMDLWSGIVEDVLTLAISPICMSYRTKAFGYATFRANGTSGVDTQRWFYR